MPDPKGEVDPAEFTHFFEIYSAVAQNVHQCENKLGVAVVEAHGKNCLSRSSSNGFSYTWKSRQPRR